MAMDKSLYVKDNVRTWIDRTVDVLIKTDIMGFKGFSEYFSCGFNAAVRLNQAAANFIACIADFDLINLNTPAVIRGICSQYKCSEEEFIDAVNEYISKQEDGLWEALSMTGAPSAEELMDHVLTKYIEEIVSEAEIVGNINYIYTDYSEMLFDPVIKHWKDNLEDKCSFRLRLYDIHNGLAEETEHGTKDDAMELIDCKTMDNAEKYSRCVVMIRTPFASDHDSVYTIYGGFSAAHICRSTDRAKEWRAVFYDYTDRKIDSVDSKRYISGEELTQYAHKIGAMYYVLLYRRTSEEDFTVQYFRAVPDPCNSDLLYTMEETVFMDI